MIDTAIIVEIAGKVSAQYQIMKAGVDAINDDSPEYYPVVTGSDDREFESEMARACVSETWDIEEIIRYTPVNAIVNALLRYFNTTPSNWNVLYVGSLDHYLYENGLTVDKHFADAVAACTKHKMSCILVENTENFIFGEIGMDEDGDYFNALGSYETEDISLPYGIYEDDYTGFAPTDEVSAQIVTAQEPINFDINLICKDVNGDTFIHSMNISGVAGDIIPLGLAEKITGISGVSQTPYDGNIGDLIRFRTVTED